MSTRIIHIMMEALPRILVQCVKVTIPLTLLSFFFGLLLALILALVQVAGIRGLKDLARFYIWIFRGTPLLVQMFIIYFACSCIIGSREKSDSSLCCNLFIHSL